MSLFRLHHNNRLLKKVPLQGIKQLSMLSDFLKVLLSLFVTVVLVMPVIVISGFW